MGNKIKEGNIDLCMRLRKGLHKVEQKEINMYRILARIICGTIDKIIN